MQVHSATLISSISSRRWITRFVSAAFSSVVLAGGGYYLANSSSPLLLVANANQGQPANSDLRSLDIPEDVHAVLKSRCYECHSGDIDEGNLSFDAWSQLDEPIRDRKLEHIVKAIRLGEMPPEGSPSLSDQEKDRVLQWADETLESISQRDANKPGDVVLRRLSNLEYNYTVRDLTGIASLNPTREFPGDNAAGEGFTNAGAAMVMSPALFGKYLDAAKEIASHAVLTPTGAEFSESTSRNDWATERLDRIRQLYARYSNNRGAEAVNLQGVAFETNQGGRLPFDSYLIALAESWPSISDGSANLNQLSSDKNFSPKYLGTLVQILTDKSDSPLIQELQARWGNYLQSLATDSQAKKDAAKEELTNWIGQWQKELWKFSSVGHIGKLNGPKAWQEPVSPLATNVTLKAPVTPSSESLLVRVKSYGSSTSGNVIHLTNPRFVRAGEPDISLADAMGLDSRWKQFADQLAGSTAATLDVVSGVSKPLNRAEINELAKSKSVSAESLVYWLGQVGLTREDAQGASERQDALLTESSAKMGEHEGIQGWIGKDALSIIANSKDEVQRIPGWIAPRSVAVHPAPDRSVGLGLVIGSEGSASISGQLEHVHTECGNGTSWNLEVVRSGRRIVLATGHSAGKQVVPIGPFPMVPLLAGDEVCLQVSPRDNNHSCDMTRIDLTVEQADKKWNAAESLTGRIHESNPLPAENGAHWRFYSQPTSAWGLSTVPANSLLTKWWLAPSAEDKQAVALELQSLLTSPEKHASAPPQDQQLIRNLASVKNYLQLAGADNPKETLSVQTSKGTSQYAQKTIVLDNESWARIPVPAALRNGWEFVVDATLDPSRGVDGAVQLLVTEQSSNDVDAGLAAGTPVLVHAESSAREKLEAAFEEFRQLFPAALCYYQIVPVDEVVTLTLYHREDELLKKLMLSEHEQQELDRLWDELHYVSRDAFQSVDAYEQLWQYATQDADPSAFEPLRQPLLDRAAAFQQSLLDSEPVHVKWLLQFARKAYRRDLEPSEHQSIQELYSKLREQGLEHEVAVQGCIARILVSPEFLYRLETPAKSVASAPISADELATRLSYFLWASAPDEELLQLAHDGTLVQDDVLKGQMRRMLQDPKAKRFARAFLGQWLQVANIAELDEKSEAVFPEFIALRESIQKESDKFFENLVVGNRPPLELLTADYTFVNSDLMALYGIKEEEHGASGEASLDADGYQKITDIQRFNRGGFMRQASVLAKNSGASRTSAILRGTWVSEVLLGEHLPKPPKNVPPLPESVPDNLSERQLIELHVNAPECAGCHKRIDPFGFALEEFDAIGRYRVQDTANRPIDSATELPDGTEVQGHQELVNYLSEVKKTQYLTQFHRKLLGYAIGREVALSDRPMIQSLVSRSLSDPSYGVWDAVEAVVLSRQFREIRGEEKE